MMQGLNLVDFSSLERCLSVGLCVSLGQAPVSSCLMHLYNQLITRSVLRKSLIICSRTLLTAIKLDLFSNTIER